MIFGYRFFIIGWVVENEMFNKFCMLWQEKYFFCWTFRSPFTIWYQFGPHEIIFSEHGNWLMPEHFCCTAHHWRKLPYWVFIPVDYPLQAQSLYFRYHPDKNCDLGSMGRFATHFSHTFLLLFPGRHGRARLSKDPLGARSPYLKKILRTHWIRQHW